MILSQAKTTDGTITEWANTPIGFSKNLIHAKGSAVVLLAEIMDLSPIEVNEKLKSVEGFTEDQILWEKIVPAFPNWSAQVIAPYDNKAVLDALSSDRFVIVLTENGHAVRYMGNGICHDPLDGTEKPTSTYPNVKACVILTHIVKPEDISLVEPPVEPPKDSPPIEKLQEAKEYIEKDSALWELDQRQTDVIKQLKKIRAATIEIKKLLNVQ